MDPPVWAQRFRAFQERYCFGWPLLVAVLTSVPVSHYASRLGDLVSVRAAYDREARADGFEMIDHRHKIMSDGSKMPWQGQLVYSAVAPPITFANFLAWLYGLGYLRMRQDRARPPSPKTDPAVVTLVDPVGHDGQTGGRGG
jgi:hypothetical protein